MSDKSRFVVPNICPACGGSIFGFVPLSERMVNFKFCLGCGDRFMLVDVSGEGYWRSGDTEIHYPPIDFTPPNRNLQKEVTFLGPSMLMVGAEEEL